MRRPTETCHICGFTEENPPPLGLTAESRWTRPGLCRECAGLGLDWTPCKPCARPIVWATTEKNRRPIPVDCRPAGGMAPNLVLYHDADGKLIARHAHPEYIRIHVVPGNGLRTGVAHHATCPFGPAMRRGR